MGTGRLGSDAVCAALLPAPGVSAASGAGLKLDNTASKIALEMTEAMPPRVLTLISSLYHSGWSGFCYVLFYPEDRKKRASVMLFGLLIEESGSQLKVAIEGGGNFVVMLPWFDAFALEGIFHRGHGIGGKRMIGG